MMKGHRDTEEGARGGGVSNGIWVSCNQVQGRLGDVGGEQFSVSADAVTVVTVGARRKWKSRVQLSVIAPPSTTTNTDMSLPYSVSGLSKKRKHSAAEDREKGVGSSGTGLGDPDGPPPAPAHREHLQGQEFGDTRKRTHPSRHTNSATSDATRQDQEAIVSTEARSILCEVKEAPNAHPPLKSVAEDLCFVLDNYKV